MTIAGLFRRIGVRGGEAQPLAVRSAAARTAATGDVLDRPDRALWAVADAVGASRDGAIAAAVAIDALAGLADSSAPIGPAAIRFVLEAADHALGVPGPAALRAGGAAVVAVHLDGACATILWAGDSRVYRLRDERLQRLTRDHSVAEEMIAAGTPPPDAPRRAHTRVVTRAIGAGGTVEIDRVDTIVRSGDVLLLCSHHLPGILPAAMIAGRLRHAVDDAPHALIEAARAAGAGGALSAVVVVIGGEGDRGA